MSKLSYFFPFVVLISIFTLLFGITFDSITQIKLSIFNILLSFLLMGKFILLDTQYFYMSKKDELLYNINDKISELHQSHFFGGKKKKEINNFGIGILLGIGLSLIVEAGISFWVGIEKFNYIGKELAVNNLSISNLSFMEQVEYKNLFFSDLNLALIVILGCFISSLVIFLYVNINKNLFNHKVIYSYKFKKDKSMP